MKGTPAIARWRSGAATDPGRMRTENQDRNFVDEAAGIFLVIDGLGGHAAGEKAAETARDVIPIELKAATGDTPNRIRAAITTANNRICDLADADPNLRGMACVLTLAVACDGRIFIGHVGDSRLYLVWNGAIRKLTSDHSPVGEREDRGELTEQEAMNHPRRHEVFRDVGSRRRDRDDPEFVEIKEFLFKPDSAMLICSDGLSDLVAASQIAEIIERYDGDANRVAAELVEAANQAGGKDNITAIFVAGPEFLGNSSPEMAEARARHSVTKKRTPEEIPAGSGGRLLLSRGAFLVYGFILGLLLALFWR